MTPEQAKHAIFLAIRAIPRGRVAAYSDIARRAGLPGRARLVGRVLRESPSSMKLPWHRVLRADGRPAFPPGSEPYKEQVRRLSKEGVELIGARVPARCFVDHDDDLDAALWGPR